LHEGLFRLPAFQENVAERAGAGCMILRDLPVDMPDRAISRTGHAGGRKAEGGASWA
jgi:hypothetical protein